MFLTKIEILRNVYLNVIRNEQKEKFKFVTKTYNDKVLDNSFIDNKRPWKRKYVKKVTNQDEFLLFRKGFSLTFESKLTIIVGDNGCGKTSLVKYLKPKEEGFGNLFSKLSEEEFQEKRTADYLVNDTRKLTYEKQPELLVIENSIHKNSFIKNFAETHLNPNTNFGAIELLSMWDMQSFSNGENTLDFLRSLKQINNSLIILDEPETSLSIKSVKKTREIINELISNGNQVIIITHHPILMEISDKVYDFEKKKMVDTQKYIKEQLK